MRTVGQIDRDIGTVRAELTALAPHLAALGYTRASAAADAAAWQAAWDTHPELRQRERALYDERYDAQAARDRTIARQQAAAERRARRQEDAVKSYVAYVETAAGEHIELALRVRSPGEARYLAQRAQVDGKVIAVLLRAEG